MPGRLPCRASGTAHCGCWKEPDDLRRVRPPGMEDGARRHRGPTGQVGHHASAPPAWPRSWGSTRCGSTTTSTTCRCPPTRPSSSAGAPSRRWPASTSTIRLGQMVSCAGYRNPALVAKITSTVDVISGGRLDWGIGAGWYDQEYRAYGYDFPSAADRIRVLRETVEIVKLMWTRARRHLRRPPLPGGRAQCDPKPVQDPHPPVWIGGGGEQLTLRVVARHADRSNFGGKPHEWSHKCEVLHGALPCRGPGLRRDHQDVVAGGLHPRGRGRDRRRRHAQLLG